MDKLDPSPHASFPFTRPDTDNAARISTESLTTRLASNDTESDTDNMLAIITESPSDADPDTNPQPFALNPDPCTE